MASVGGVCQRKLTLFGENVSATDIVRLLISFLNIFNFLMLTIVKYYLKLNSNTIFALNLKVGFCWRGKHLLILWKENY